jgi:hypothetical protein
VLDETLHLASDAGTPAFKQEFLISSCICAVFATVYAVTSMLDTMYCSMYVAFRYGFPVSAYPPEVNHWPNVIEQYGPTNAATFAYVHSLRV